MAVLSVGAAAQTVLGERLDREVLPALTACLEGLTASSDDWLALLTQVYAPQEAGFLEPFSERAEQIRQGLLDGSFTLRLELRSAQELQGNLAAYAAGEAGFSERILINADWAATASTVDLERRLLEELGHAFDQRLNLGVDTQGDEGQLFAARVLGDPLDPFSFSAISQENDGGVLQLDGQAVSVEFAADPSYNAATYDTDHDGINDASDLDDDNDGILDNVEAKTGGVVWQPTRDEFSYAQNTAGGNTTHDAAGSFLSGDINDPFNFFDGNDTTELRVHALDVYEFRLPSTGVKAGSSFTLREGAVGNSYDGVTMVLASLGTTDPSGNQNNAKGGGVGWKTISQAFGNVATPTALGALFTGTPIISTDQKFVLLYYGTSDQDQTLTTPIDVNYLQIVGIQTHGGWGDISVASQVDLTLDTDHDGIPNSRDLDSDNDGISDLYESVGSSTSASVVQADISGGVIDGTISRNEAISYLTASGGWLDPSRNDPDYNKNGLWDFLDSSGATAANTPVDTDADGVADLLDLDSDNDGIPDTVEARASANYKGNDFALDPSGVRNNDADGDGVINLFDSNDASGATFGGSFNTPVNTDASGEGSVPTFQETGPPINATVDVSVDGIKIGDIQSILKQDTSYAEINRGSGATPDMLVLDMGKNLPVGSKVLIRALTNDLSGSLKLAQTDIAGNNPSNDTEVFFATKNVYALIEYTITSTSTQYIRFMTNSRDRRIRIDSVSWGAGVQGVGQANPDYLDADSDEDTFLDRFESGLSLSGLDVNGDGIDDAIAASYDDPDGNVWTGVSDPSGLQLGLKNVDSNISEYDYRSTPTANDLFVSDNVTVNEASSWANFSISGSPGKQVFLRLNTLGVGPGFATDTSGASPSNPADYGPTIQVLVGAAWVNYTDASGVTLDGSGAALARVSIINDLSGVVHEGPEFYQLEARDASGVISSGGIGIIDDEGTGDVFLTSNTTDVPDDPSGGLYYDGSGQFGLDDDRVVQIDNLRINEGSPYAVFQLTGTTEKFTLALEGSLQNAQWTATKWDGSGGALDASGLKDFGPSLEYWDASGSQWILYTTQQLTLPESGELLVRTPINQDLLLETDASGHGETFRLKATRVVDSRVSSGGIGEIFDTGAGSIYPGTVDASGKLIVDPSGSIYDDDTPIGINNVTVNEASKWAVFNLEGPSNLGFRLSLIQGNQTAQLAPAGSKDATEGSDYGTIAQIEILNNSGGWDSYIDASGAALDSFGEGKVRVRILNDSPAAYEGPETYTLRATTSAGVVSLGGLGVIVDDGSGLIFDPSSGAIDNAAAKDDERVLDVSGGIYNEASKWAVFIVKGVSGQEAVLDLSGNTATEWTGSGTDPYDPSGLQDFGPNLQVQDASGHWNDYTPGTSVFLDGSGNLKVRTRLYNDPLFETIAPNVSGETFDLIAISGGGIQSSGTATILDNGQGILLDLSGNPDPSGVRDNDLPRLAVQGPANPVSEGSPLVFTVTMDHALPTDTVISLKLRDVTTETADYAPNLNAVGEVFYFDGTGQVVTLKSAGPDQFTLPAGVSQLYVRVPSNFDEIYEGEEELSLSAGLVDFPGTDASGSGFITDDGTGSVYDGIVDPSSGELGIDGTKVPDNDVPTLTITTLTPRISEGSVGFFSITLDKALETAAPLSLSLFPGPGTPEADDNDFLFSSSVLQISWFEGLDLKMTRILLDDAVNGSILYPAGIQEIFVSFETVADDVYEGAENFTLRATLDLGLVGPSAGLLARSEVRTLAAPLALPQLTADASANIVDDGTGTSYTGILYPSGDPQVSVFTTPDNDIPSLGVTSLIPEISEGNNGLFQIDLGSPLAFEAELNLQLRPGTAATDDYSGPVPSRVFFLDPGDGSRVFVPIDGSGNLLVPVGVTTLFAVVETTPDDRYDGDATFFLDALLNLPGVTDPSGSASALISDDGSAPVYKQDLSGNPLLDGGLPELDPSGTPDNDIPSLGVTSLIPEISEGNNGLFQIDLGSPLAFEAELNLQLRPGTAATDDYNGPVPSRVFFLDPGDGSRVFVPIDGSGNLLVPVGVTTLFAVVETTPDDRYDGDATFFLDALLNLPGVTDPSGSASALISDDGSAPVYKQDLSGNPLLDGGLPELDPSGTPDNDIPSLGVTNLIPEISEGNNGLFQIDLVSPLAFEAELNLQLRPGTAATDDYNGPVPSRVFFLDPGDGSRVFVPIDGSGNLLVPVGVKTLFAVVESTPDDRYDGDGTFFLDALLNLPGVTDASGSASALISDDGSAPVYKQDLSGNPLLDGGLPELDPSGAPDNDIPSLGVTNLIPEISEGNNGLFQIDLGSPLAFEAELNLQLRPGTAATDDYNGPVPSRVFFLDPGDGSRVFVPIDGSGNLLVPVGVTTLFAVVETTPDDRYDGDATFFLDALLNLPGVTDPSGSASALISDDGSAPVYKQDLSGNPLLDGGLPELDPSGTSDNDTPGFGVTSLTPKITEGRSGLFRIDLTKPLALTSPIYLGLRNGTAENDDYDFPAQAQVFYLDPSGDRAYLSLDPSSGLVNLPAMVTTLYVVVDTTPDDVFEGPESFFLDGHLDLPGTADDLSGSAGALITDDGSAPVYATDPSGNLLLDPSSGAPFVDSSGIPDDDRTLRIVGGVYNEASPYLFWLVEGNAGQPIRWVDLVGDPSGAEPGGDLSGPLQYRDASGIWQSLSAISNPVLDASGELLIRKAVVNDDQSEGLENFSLTLEYPDGPRAIGVSSLINDGSGLIPALDGSGSPIGFDESGNLVSSQDANKDDDRALEVSGSTVNEASLFTFFKVDGAPDQLVTLSLKPGTAKSGSDYINQIEYSSDAGRTWTLYTPESGFVSLNGEGALLVRVPIVNDQPPADEPDETFQLRAGGTGGTAAIGTATIVDGGNGTIYNPDGSPDPSGTPDDDALPPRLVPTDDGQGLKVIGQAGKSLWIDLSVTMADASLQNGFDLIKVNAQGQRSRIGAIGATPDSGFLGDNRYQFVVGEELRFVQVSSDLPANSRPDLQITGTDNCALVGLDEDGGEGDADDLALMVKTSETDPYPRSSRMARFQQGSELAYLDLSWIGSEGITLHLDVQTDADNLNTIGLVKVDTDASGNPLGTVAGVAPSAGAAFDTALRANLISYSHSQSGSQALKAPALTLTGSQAGVYAPVLFTEGDVIYTFGSNSSSDRRQHVKVLGANSFGFEDLPGLQADWDYNDAVVSFHIADPTTPRLNLSSNGQGLTVVAGTGPADGLWLDLNAILAEAGNQNSLDLFVRDVSGVSTQVGSIGATSGGTFLGAKELFLGVGETLTFVQNTKDNAPDAAPALRITQIGDRYRLSLEDAAATGGDRDFNDFVIDIDRTPLDPCEEVVNLAALQTSSSAGLLDLSTIGAEGLKLNLAIQTDSGNTNTLGFVKLDSASTNGQYSVDGVAVGNSEAFRKSVRENLIDFRVSAGGKGEADPAVWQLVAADAGIYAAVLLTPDNDVYTPGDAAAADGRQHLKVLGDSSFGFEDLLADKGSDFDFNDFVVKITPVT